VTATACDCRGEARLGARPPPTALLPCRRVVVWEFSGLAHDAGDEAARWFTAFCGQPVRLVRYAGGGAASGGPQGAAAEWTGGGKPVLWCIHGTPPDWPCVLTLAAASGVGSQPAVGAVRAVDPEFGAGAEVAFADGYPLLVAAEVGLSWPAGVRRAASAASQGCRQGRDRCQAHGPGKQAGRPASRGGVVVGRRGDGLLPPPRLQENLAALNQHMGLDMPMKRFRPNVVVAGLGPAWTDDSWRAVEVQPADGSSSLSLAYVKPCDRCKVGAAGCACCHLSCPLPALPPLQTRAHTCVQLRTGL
jgi:uncharacterized protein YcbX